MTARCTNGITSSSEVCDDEYGTKRLAASVLLRALSDALGVVGSGDNKLDRASVQRRAVAWFASDDDGPLSLIAIAETLCIPTTLLRRTVMVQDQRVTGILRWGTRHDDER